MNRILKFSLIGCGGLIVLFILLGILGAIISGGSSTEQASDSGEWDQSEGEVYRGEDPSLFLRTFDSQEEFENFVDQQKEEEAQRAKREKQEAERAQRQAVEQQAQAEQEQQEAEAAQEEAGASAVEEPADVSTAIVRVTGEAGQTFSGSYGSMDTQQSIDGTVPQEFEQEIDTGLFTVDSVTAVMQKNTPGTWELRVQIVVDGEVVKETSTTAEYGVATVTWDTTEQ